ncbi:hypothetical protein ACM66B_002561 [Microbotryomycetes sp. NB124-2]
MQPSTSSPVSPHRHAPALQSMYQQTTFGQSSLAQQHGSASSFGANVSTAIPFPQPHGPAPGQMGFGFGLSAASSLNLRSSVGWGIANGVHEPSASSPTATRSSPAPNQYHLHHHLHSQHRAIPMMQTGSGNGALLQSSDSASSPSRLRAAGGGAGHRRRRSSFDSASEDERATTDRHRTIRGVKKARTLSTRDDERVAAMNKDVDLGKALASLSKESLLSVLSNLITTQPQLRPTIQALLPPPTLSGTLATLANLERNVTAAIPSGSTLREEYVWGRVRLPLEEYVAEAKSFLSSFISAATAPQPAQQVHASVGTAEEDICHPSTTFAFLHALTASIRRLEFALPSSVALVASASSVDPLSSHLLPLTVNCWHIFLTKLSTSVNQEGRMISAGMLRGWFSKMDELTIDSPGRSAATSITNGARPEGLAKKACEGVRDRMRKEVGWLVGIRDVAQVSQMDDEEL